MAKRKRSRKRFFLRGGITASLLFILAIIIFGFVVSQTLVNKSQPQDDEVWVNAKCCDTGNGDSCQPQTGDGKTITYNGQEYGLLRSKTVLLEGNVHLKDSGQITNGKPIILNSSDTHIIPPEYATNECKTEPLDKYIKEAPQPPIVIGSPESVSYCTSIPNDQIIYVCTKNCFPAQCGPEWGPEVTCYGNAESEYDAYFRLSDVENGIPDFVKNCSVKNLSYYKKVSSQTQRVVTPTPEEGKKNLQLRTFGLVTEESIIPWLSPFCKPAIYLYPDKTMPINVKVDPIGPMKITIPPYPTDGWSVIANPYGEIYTQNATHDYLFYEAQIPDEKIAKPTNGYVVDHKDLEAKLTKLMPTLGLNYKETNQFVEYWTEVLPQAPFYFIGIISPSNLDQIAPLTIYPKPQTNIRVSLFFEALQKPKEILEPKVNTPIRFGYTMVEWGGIFKKDPKYPFSCFQ